MSDHHSVHFESIKPKSRVTKKKNIKKKQSKNVDIDNFKAEINTFRIT